MSETGDLATCWKRCFGGEAVRHVLDCMANTDVTEMAATGCRALKCLVAVEANLAAAVEAKAHEVLQTTVDELTEDPMLAYRAGALLQTLKDAASGAPKESSEPDARPW